MSIRLKNEKNSGTNLAAARGAGQHLLIRCLVQDLITGKLKIHTISLGPEVISPPLDPLSHLETIDVWGVKVLYPEFQAKINPS